MTKEEARNILKNKSCVNRPEMCAYPLENPEGYCEYADAINMAIEALKQPDQKWIPCSERLPEEREWMGTKRFGTTISDEVFVTFESADGVRFVKHLCFQNGKLSLHDQKTIDVFYKGATPIAWKPLPEPYEGS